MASPAARWSPARSIRTHLSSTSTSAPPFGLNVALPPSRQSTYTHATSTNRAQFPPRNSLIDRLGLNTVKPLKRGSNVTIPNGHHPDPPTKQREARAQPMIKPCSLRAMPPATHPLPLRSMDWDEAVSAFSRCKIQHTSHLLTLKVIPSSSIPSLSGRNAKIDHGKTPFAIVTSIKSISKKAVMRNRVRTRFKEAVRLVITRDVDVNLKTRKHSTSQAEDEVLLPDDLSGKVWLIPNHHYIAYPTKAVYDVPMPELISAVRFGLEDLARKHGKGTINRSNAGKRSVSSVVDRRKAGRGGGAA